MREKERESEREKEKESKREKKREWERQRLKEMVKERDEESKIEWEWKIEIGRESVFVEEREEERKKSLEIWIKNKSSNNLIHVPGIPSTMKGILCPPDSIRSDEFPKLPWISSKFNIALRTPLKMLNVKIRR